jgi:hypothetical protein
MPAGLADGLALAFRKALPADHRGTRPNDLGSPLPGLACPGTRPMCKNTVRQPRLRCAVTARNASGAANPLDGSFWACSADQAGGWGFITVAPNGELPASAPGAWPSPRLRSVSSRSRSAGAISTCRFARIRMTRWSGRPELRRDGRVPRRDEPARVSTRNATVCICRHLFRILRWRSRGRRDACELDREAATPPVGLPTTWVSTLAPETGRRRGRSPGRLPAGRVCCLRSILRTGR